MDALCLRADLSLAAEVSEVRLLFICFIINVSVTGVGNSRGPAVLQEERIAPMPRSLLIFLLVTIDTLAGHVTVTVTPVTRLLYIWRQHDEISQPSLADNLPNSLPPLAGTAILASIWGRAAGHLWKHRNKYATAGRLLWKGYQMYNNSRGGGASSRTSLRAMPRSRSRGSDGAPAGAMLAASHYRIRRRKRLPRRLRRVIRRRRVKKARFRRAVRRAVGSKSVPKWIIFRSTALLSPTSQFTTTGQTLVDIAHGHQSHYDGIVAMQQAAKMNIAYGISPAPTAPDIASTYCRVKKSYMVLFITNNSVTPVYGKMAVFKPRKHINLVSLQPSAVANADIESSTGPVANEYVSQQAYANLGIGPNYSDYDGFTDGVLPTNLTDIGWIWQNSTSFKKYYKGKIRNVTWGPQECKKFTFKMRKSFSIDAYTEYTLRPATSPNPSLLGWDTTANFYTQPTQSGFAEMHAKRGFYVSFMLHGVPARDSADTTVGLTQPKMDMFWLNAYKYSWSDPTRREWHMGGDNPLGSVVPQFAIPGFGTVPGAPQVAP